MDNNSFVANNSTETMTGLPTEVIAGYNAYLSVVIALGVPGNLLVLLVYMKNGATTSTDWFIIFITLCDFLSSLINVPIYLTFTSGTWRYYGNDIICKLHMFLSQSIVLSSTFLICGLALERYFKICRPNMTKMTRAMSRNMCMVISLIAVVFSIPCFAFFRNKYNRCGTVTAGLLVKLLNAYYTAVLLSFITAVFILIFSYSKIAVAIYESEFNLKKHFKGKSCSNNQRSFKEGICLPFCCISNKIYPIPETSSDRTAADTQTISLSVSQTQKPTVQGNVSKGGYTSYQNTENMKSSAETKVVKCACASAVSQTNRAFDQTNRPVDQTNKAIDQTNRAVDQTNRAVDQTNRTVVPTKRTTPPSTIANGQNTLMVPPRHSKTALQPPEDRPTCSCSGSIISGEKITSAQTRNEVHPATSFDISSLAEHRRVRQSLKTTRIAFLICLIFVLSWLPPWISFINFVFLPPKTKLTSTYVAIQMFSRMAYLFNSFTNPILYTILNKKFRDKLRKCVCMKWIIILLMRTM